MTNASPRLLWVASFSNQLQLRIDQGFLCIKTVSMKNVIIYPPLTLRIVNLLSGASAAFDPVSICPVTQTLTHVLQGSCFSILPKMTEITVSFYAIMATDMSQYDVLWQDISHGNGISDAGQLVTSATHGSYSSSL